MGRSKPEPSFRRSAGARLTVIRRPGHSSSAEAMPLRYTGETPIDAARQLAVWGSQLLDTLGQSAEGPPSSEEPARA